jgi:adenylate cyclase
MERIAESSAASMRLSYETPMRTNTAYPEWVELIAPIVHNFLERLTKVMDITLRHHLREISARNYAVDSEGTATTVQMAIGFADMVGFTARSGASSIRELAGAIDEFEGRVADTVASSGGRVVKFIGDEVMFAFEDPRSACRCALDLLALAADDTIPEVRVGLSYGEVVNRYGDYYGPVVNLASRLVDFAPAGGILAARELADEARDAFAFEPQDPHRMKGIEAPVEHLRLLSSD